MDETSKFLEYLVVSQKQLPTGYCNFSPNLPLVDQAVDLIPSSIDPTLPLKSEFKVVYLVSSSINPTLPLKSEVKVVNLIPTSIYLALPLESDVL
jgi:hypothetical protein